LKYIYQAVERIPDQLSEGVVYHNRDFELAALLCACGCGHRITLLVPDGHRVISDHGLATIEPSIGVLDAACKSHFFITNGQVRWLPAFSGAEATAIMRGQIARHAKLDPQKLSWADRVRLAFNWMANLIKSFFR